MVLETNSHDSTVISQMMGTHNSRVGMLGAAQKSSIEGCSSLCPPSLILCKIARRQLLAFPHVRPRWAAIHVSQPNVRVPSPTTSNKWEV